MPQDRRAASGAYLSAPPGRRAPEKTDDGSAIGFSQGHRAGPRGPRPKKCDTASHLPATDGIILQGAKRQVEDLKRRIPTLCNVGIGWFLHKLVAPLTPTQQRQWLTKTTRVDFYGVPLSALTTAGHEAQNGRRTDGTAECIDHPTASDHANREWDGCTWLARILQPLTTHLGPISTG